MPIIEFIYDKDCPNVADSRQALAAALAHAGLPATWQEWDRANPAAPDYARHYGSPTVLVNGRDVAGFEPEHEPACRIYAHEQGRQRGVVPRALIDAALAPYARRRFARGTQFVAWLPAVGAALLPKLTCPACWPAYAALLSALGIGFVDYTPYLLPTVTLLLGINLWTLAYRAKRRRGYGPFALGAVGAFTLLLGSFWIEREGIVWVAASVLIVAAIWNLWPRRAQSAAACPACEVREPTAAS
ncbi:MAG: MerC domain-containing protein [Pseudomonadota bacterium]|nr:MAG: MerC domain-containing protein [Pseudomonadota bacterium]